MNIKEGLDNLSDGVWALIIAASDIEQYCGKIDPHTGEITIKPVDQLKPGDRLVDREAKSS